jgi:hypothetical protein
MGSARDGGLRLLEATPPAASIVVARSAARMKRATDKPRGTHVVRAFSASPHDEISPERHRWRLEAPADISQRIDDLYGTLIRAVAKRAPF